MTQTTPQESETWIWQFDDVQLDESSMELRVGGALVKLERKPKQVLGVLLRHAGQVVSKDALIAQAWPGRVVSDSAVTSCVARLRTAIGDKEQSAIVTVHGLGYRLDAAPSTSVPTPQQPVQPSARAGRTANAEPAGTLAPGRWSSGARIASICVAALLIGLAFWQWPKADDAPAVPSIAVLPFETLSDDAEADSYLADGLHDSVLTQLAKLDDIKVISRTSMMRFANQRALSIPQIAQSVGVDHILEGTVQRVGGRMKVIAQLIDARTDAHIWAESYERTSLDVLGLQAEIAREVARQIGHTLTPREQAALQDTVTVSPSAAADYQKALALWRKNSTDRGTLIKAEGLLKRIVFESPAFAPAHALLSKVHSYMYWFAFDQDTQRRQWAGEAARTALDLDPSLADGYLALGLYRSQGFDDDVGALEAYQKAVEIAPGSAEAQWAIARNLRGQQKFSAALDRLNQALALDPLNTRIIQDAAQMHEGMRLFDAAALLYDRLVSLAPDVFFYHFIRAQLDVLADGNLEPMRALLDTDLAEQNPKHAHFGRFLLAVWEQRHADAYQHMRAYPDGSITGFGGKEAWSRAGALAERARKAGMSDVAAQHLKDARRFYDAQAASLPDEIPNLLSHASLHVVFGDPAAAQRDIRRALALMPEERNYQLAVTYKVSAASILMEIDKLPRALELLLSLGDTPYGYSGHMLMLTEEFEPLHDDPEFQALVTVRKQPPSSAAEHELVALADVKPLAATP